MLDQQFWLGIFSGLLICCLMLDYSWIAVNGVNKNSRTFKRVQRQDACIKIRIRNPIRFNPSDDLSWVNLHHRQVSASSTVSTLPGECENVQLLGNLTICSARIEIYFAILRWVHFIFKQLLVIQSFVSIVMNSSALIVMKHAKFRCQSASILCNSRLIWISISPFSIGAREHQARKGQKQTFYLLDLLLLDEFLW